MIVANSLMRRRPDIDIRTFEEHWLDPHGPLTAKLPGCRHYVQNHIIQGPGTNRLARELRIDGIPQLAFDTPEARLAAHNSPELKTCDQDSQLFVGAVSRVMTKVDGNADFLGPPGTVKQIFLFIAPKSTEGSSSASGLDPTAIIARLEGVHRVVHHHILEQTRAPGSKVSNLEVSVNALCEVWTESAKAIERNSGVLDQLGNGLATFAVKVYRFI